MNLVRFDFPNICKACTLYSHLEPLYVLWCGCRSELLTISMFRYNGFDIMRQGYLRTSVGYISSTIPRMILGVCFMLMVLETNIQLAESAVDKLTIGGLFPMIWAEEAECAGHLLAAADRINNKTDGYLDSLLPEVRSRKEHRIFACLE